MVQFVNFDAIIRHDCDSLFSRVDRSSLRELQVVECNEVLVSYLSKPTLAFYDNMVGIVYDNVPPGFHLWDLGVNEVLFQSLQTVIEETISFKYVTLTQIKFFLDKKTMLPIHLFSEDDPMAQSPAPHSSEGILCRFYFNLIPI
jgi:hypothetical protein